MRQYCKEGDVILAADHGVMYEAKVLRIENLGPRVKYFIHYNGWHRKFDCWIDETLVAQKNDEEKKGKIQAKLDGSAKQQPVATGKGGKRGGRSKAPDSTGASSVDHNKESGVPIDSTADGEKDSDQPAAEAESTVDDKVGAKRKNESLRMGNNTENVRRHKKNLAMMDLVDEDDENFVSKVQIPFPLKRHLVDEWGMITNTTPRLLKLPKENDRTVERLIRDFLASKTRGATAATNGNASSGTGTNTSNGTSSNTTTIDSAVLQAAQYQSLFEALLLHFDKALPTILLYRQERDQYDALCVKFPSSRPSQLYGAEHLLRFFVRLPKQLGNVFLPPEDTVNIITRLLEILKFINKSINKYIELPKYVEVGEAMLELATVDSIEAKA
mmetsp:Transcript_25070/g.41771  ORF Transcript_25070/g.41771 Transcript_25070/m.41771 type:complete len:386 (+) Transcript_25070:60-1217(+)